ncbi:predicted protein [Pyrenophora tritici-repentis Pt-1C-BFP]|uniref:Uncharacterized protein n=1 Tax=Pyrenophora tritici-repentis (strain Pt-1C-BFP) TaxID=426418 RepID=B2W394_PYRTR|nr:uncharacterized protein PTRG_04944 [Pyrenophora tritici-repentis Pt-1C-BFP]EDU47851.1 predicted protein [Pyrenophora tritici-repentis Pt-1C-BFP]
MENWQRFKSTYYYDKAFTPELYYPLGPIPSNVHDLVPLVRRIKNFKKTEHRYPPVFNEDRTVVTGLMDRIGEGGWTIDKAIDFYALKQHPFIGEENISNKQYFFTDEQIFHANEQHAPAYEVDQIDSTIVRLHNALTANKLLATLHQTLCLHYAYCPKTNLQDYPNDQFTSEEKAIMEAAIAKATETTRLAREKGSELLALVQWLRRLDHTTGRLIECKREISNLKWKIAHPQRALDDAKNQNPMDVRPYHSFFDRDLPPTPGSSTSSRPNSPFLNDVPHTPRHPPPWNHQKNPKPTSQKTSTVGENEQPTPPDIHEPWTTYSTHLTLDPIDLPGKEEAVKK